MSRENVEFVRSLQHAPDGDAKAAVEPDGSDRLRDAIGHLFDPEVECTMRLPGMAPVTYQGGLSGLKAAWQDWLKSWANYQVEIEDVIDGGERIVVIHRARGRRRPNGPETTLRRAAIWTVRNRRVVRVDFNLPCVEALAALEAQS